MKQCPQYEILDQVMGTRPNVTPPFVSASSSFGHIGHARVLEAADIVEIDEDISTDNQDGGASLDKTGKYNK